MHKSAPPRVARAKARRRTLKKERHKGLPGTATATGQRHVSGIKKKGAGRTPDVSNMTSLPGHRMTKKELNTSTTTELATATSEAQNRLEVRDNFCWNMELAREASLRRFLTVNFRSNHCSQCQVWSLGPTPTFAVTTSMEQWRAIDHWQCGSGSTTKPQQSGHLLP